MEHLYKAGARLGILTRVGQGNYVVSDTATKEQLQIFIDMLAEEIKHLKSENNKMGDMLAQVRLYKKEDDNNG